MTYFEHESDRNCIYGAEEIFYNRVTVKENEKRKREGTGTGGTQTEVAQPAAGSTTAAQPSEDFKNKKWLLISDIDTLLPKPPHTAFAAGMVGGRGEEEAAGTDGIFEKICTRYGKLCPSVKRGWNWNPGIQKDSQQIYAYR